MWKILPLLDNASNVLILIFFLWKHRWKYLLCGCHPFLLFQIVTIICLAWPKWRKIWYCRTLLKHCNLPQLYFFPLTTFQSIPVSSISSSIASWLLSEGTYFLTLSLVPGMLFALHDSCCFTFRYHLRPNLFLTGSDVLITKKDLTTLYCSSVFSPLYHFPSAKGGPKHL